MRGTLSQNIEMVDLRNQYFNIKEELDAAIEEVLISSQYINGPAVKQFETSLSRFLDRTQVIGCANGTDALQIALMALQLQPGDEVIVPAFTYVACAEVIALLKLVPVWADVDADTFNVNANTIEPLISPKTKALIVVHLFGQCAEMGELMNLAARFNLYVIEDVAQSLGAEYIYPNQSRQKAGTIAHIGCTSFFPSKILGAFGDGGAIMTRDLDLADRIKMISNHGQKIKYYHETIGVNSRLDSVQAAVLNVKLRYIKEYIAARAQAADYYDQALQHVAWLERPLRAFNSTHVFHQYTIKLADHINRDQLRSHLSERGIPSMVYYPLPLHKQNAYINENRVIQNLRVSEALCNRVLSLPIHTELSEEKINYISDVIKLF